MSSERALWQRLRNGVARFGDIQRVENILLAGYPDVNYCFRGVEGHIELKHCPTIPPRAAPFTRFRGLEEEQIDWIIKRVKHGGRVFILAQISTEVFLMKGEVACQFNALKIDDFRGLACWSANRTITAEQWTSFIDALSK